MNPTVEKALQLIKHHKFAALARETELQEQARLCHQEAFELANIEIKLQNSQSEAEAKAFIDAITLKEAEIVNSL